MSSERVASMTDRRVCLHSDSELVTGEARTDSPLTGEHMGMFAVSTRISRLHVFGDGYRSVAKHVDVAAHLVVVPAIDDGLGHRCANDRIRENVENGL
jgi:hypothetical protein